MGEISAKTSDERQIVILGAGYAGLSTALKLEQLLKRNRDLTILLIDRYNYHQLKTELHEAAAGRISLDLASIPIAGILKERAITFVRAEIDHIDFAHQIVSTAAGGFRYGKLVIALGGQTEFYGIPGLREHALTLDSVEDANRIKKHILKMFAQARDEPDKAKRSAMLTFVVGGGGFTGVELATELVEYVSKLSKHFGITGDETQLIILEASESILPGFDRELIERTTEIIRSKGIGLMLKTRCVSIDSRSIRLKTGERIPTCTVIWTGGVRANDLVGKAGLRYGPRRRILVNPFLESVDHPNVYVIGDNALVLDQVTNQPLAPTAQLALQQGEYVARAIYAQVKELQRTRFVPEVVGQFVSLGNRDAVGWLWGFKITGFAAWFLKRITLVQYLYKIGGAKLVLQRFC